MNQSIILSKMSVKFLLLFVFTLLHNQIYSQKSLNVKYVENNNFKIDGVLDETAWETAETTSDFHEYFPTDNKLEQYQTEIKMLYNDDFLYVAMKDYSPGNHYRTPSYQRDYSVSGADVISLMFDTYSDRANAFLFGINPFGVLREGIITAGGVTGKLDLSWNTKWIGEAKVYDGYCTYEVRIPMSAFKFKEGVLKWKFNAMRVNTQANTKGCWSRVPQNQNQLNLGFFGDMIFEKPLIKVKSPISVIPYITPSYIHNYTNDKKTFDYKVGFDVKVPVKSSLMLDLTVNPDFSSESIVAGQNNVTRFEIKQAETRQFFIDNGDLFNGFGLPDDAVAFYSRRVGLGTNANNSSSIIPIIAGAKFTGKLNKNLRIGLLNVQTQEDAGQMIPSNNNLVLAAEHRIFAKSNIGFFFINRQMTNSGESYVGTNYNRVVGSDLKFYSKDNRFGAQVYAHKSFTPGVESNAISTGSNVNYEKRRYTLTLISQYVDKGFQSDLGYTKRKDIVRANPFAEVKFYPQIKSINTVKLNISNNTLWMPSSNMDRVDYDNLLGSEVNFTSGTTVGLTAGNHFVHLSKAFSPVTGSGSALPIGDYETNDIEFSYLTNKRNNLSIEGYSNYGTFYTGNKLTHNVTFKYRFQPICFVTFKVQYDKIKLPAPYNSGELWYVGPTVNFTFTKNLFWNTDVQYSSQAKTMLIVSRLQWRYAPLSDIFLTYSDSNTTAPFTQVERGLYLKATYWFDIARKNRAKHL